MPSWPVLLAPHAHTAPSAVTAYEELSDEAIEMAAGRGAVADVFTGTGVRCPSIDPIPTWPEPLSPHAQTDPSAPSAIEWFTPAAAATTSGRPATFTGVRCRVVVPIPSWPELLLPHARS